MKIAIIDADLITKKKHRFPNLASMKISSFHKSLSDIVELKTDYKNLHDYDKIYISKVFTDTIVDSSILARRNVEYGGTGFFYDKAPFLPMEIEHMKPDYSLYDEWIANHLDKNIKEFDYYLNWSIGYTTRFCFRKCGFCVNKNYDRVQLWSKVEEFFDEKRKYICLLDDNLLGSEHWRDILIDLENTNKPFQYKQGLDERLLTVEKINFLFNRSKWKGDYIFAFDDIKDKELIEKNIKLIRSIATSKRNIKFYVFCGYDRNNIYDENFFFNDIRDTFERIKILKRYDCLPYIMRHEDFKKSPYAGIFINLASWCNQPNFFRKQSYLEWCHNDNKRKGGNSATKKYNNFFDSKYKGVLNICCERI